MSAPTRPVAADRWRQATDNRRAWLEIGLGTDEADRATTEQMITRIYARLRRPRPRFVWVRSPRAALPFLGGLPTHDDLRAWIGDRPPSGRRPVAGDIAATLSRLRTEMTGAVEPWPQARKLKRKPGEQWPVLPPVEALDRGVPFLEVLRQGVRESLFRSVADGVYLPVRRALGETATVPVGWYGNQDVAWIGYFDTLVRLGLTPARTEFAEWAALSRAGGWWWPGEDVCVCVERPAVLRTEPIRGGLHDEMRPARSIEYRDGWSV